MKSEHRSAPLPTARSASRLFAAMFAGAFALLLVDCYAAGQLGSDWIVLLLGALVVAEGTVKNHLTNILGKLGARDRAQAALIARDLGII